MGRVNQGPRSGGPVPPAQSPARRIAIDTKGRLSNQHKPLNRSDKDANALIYAAERSR